MLQFLTRSAAAGNLSPGFIIWLWVTLNHIKQTEKVLIQHRLPLACLSSEVTQTIKRVTLTAIKHQKTSQYFKNIFKIFCIWIGLSFASQIAHFNWYCRKWPFCVCMHITVSFIFKECLSYSHHRPSPVMFTFTSFKLAAFKEYVTGMQTFTFAMKVSSHSMWWLIPWLNGFGGIYILNIWVLDNYIHMTSSFILNKNA